MKREIKGKYQRNRITAWILMAFLICNLFAWGNVAHVDAIGRPTVTVGKRTKKTVILKLRSKSKVTSYQIYLKQGKKGKYTLSFAMGSKVNVKLKKLKPKETYYVKVRAVRTRGTYFQKSAFSKTKKIAPYEKKKKKTASPTPSASASYRTAPPVAPTIKPTSKPTSKPTVTPAGTQLPSSETPAGTQLPSSEMPVGTQMPSETP